MLNMSTPPFKAKMDPFLEVPDDPCTQIFVSINLSDVVTDAVFQIFNGGWSFFVEYIFQMTPEEKVKGVEVWRVRSPLKVGLEAYHTLLEVSADPVQGILGRVRWCSILHQQLRCDILSSLAEARFRSSKNSNIN